jgi:hypothetical protein
VENQVYILHRPLQAFLVPHIAEKKAHPLHVQPLVGKMLLYSKLFMFIPGIDANHRRLQFQKPLRQLFPHRPGAPGHQHLFATYHLFYSHVLSPHLIRQYSATTCTPDHQDTTRDRPGHILPAYRYSIGKQLVSDTPGCTNRYIAKTHQILYCRIEAWEMYLYRPQYMMKYIPGLKSTLLFTWNKHIH